MGGTMICGVTGTAAAQDAAELAAALAARREARAGGLRLVDRVLAEQGVRFADRRVAAGDPAEHIGRIAIEEDAELIFVGSKRHGRRNRPPLRSRLATELPQTTPVPVVVVPPQLRAPGHVAAHRDVEPNQRRVAAAR